MAKQIAKKTKDADDLPDAVDAPESTTPETTATEVPDNPGEDAGESPLKWSAQCLQRMHEDAERLLAEYDEMAGPLENPNVIKHMKGKLETLVSELEEIEDLFASEHPDLPALGEGGSKSAPGEAEEKEEDAETNPTEADSETEEETPPEEVVEGMQTKSMKCKGGKGCKCAKCVKSLKIKRKSADPDDVPGYEEHQDKPGKEASEEDIKAMDDDEPTGIPGYEENQTKPGKEGEETDFTTGLKSYERKHVKEASAFLHELGHTNEFGDEHRMKSYHFHKSLGDIGGLAGGIIGTAVGGPIGGAVGGAAGGAIGGALDSDKKQIPGYEEHQDKPGRDFAPSDIPGTPGNEEDAKVGSDFDESDLHPHRKSARDVSHFFKSLTTERAFGDAHREQAENFGKALDPIGDAMDEDNVQSPDSNPQDVGETGEKSDFPEMDKEDERDNVTEKKLVRRKNRKDFPEMDKEDEKDNVTEPGELGEKAKRMFATAAKQQKSLQELTVLAKKLAEMVRV